MQKSTKLAKDITLEDLVQHYNVPGWRSTKDEPFEPGRAIYAAQLLGFQRPKRQSTNSFVASMVEKGLMDEDDPTIVIYLPTAEPTSAKISKSRNGGKQPRSKGPSMYHSRFILVPHSTSKQRRLEVKRYFAWRIKKDKELVEQAEAMKASESNEKTLVIVPTKPTEAPETPSKPSESVSEPSIHDDEMEEMNEELIALANQNKELSEKVEDLEDELVKLKERMDYMERFIRKTLVGFA